MSYHCKCITHAECASTGCQGAFPIDKHPYYTKEELKKYQRIDVANIKQVDSKNETKETK